MVTAYLILLGVVTLQRLGELCISQRRARRLLARGAVETGRGHLLCMKVLHGLFLAGCALEVVILERPFRLFLGVAMLGVLLLAQVLRFWAIHSLGERWNIRIIVEPGVPLVRRGPYRFLPHPNYVAVVVEGLALPLVHGAWITAAVFSVANALLLLRFRIPQEERALREHGAAPPVPRAQMEGVRP